MTSVKQVLRLPQALQVVTTSTAAIRYAKRNGAPGVEFADFGRRLGLRLLPHIPGVALSYVMYPVSITRYFEYDFALQAISSQPGRCLDVSSPRLFSFFVADRNPASSVRMINPDRKDVAVSAETIASLGVANLSTEVADVRALEGVENEFDHVWSLSVVEHIGGEYDDAYAMKLMYRALAPGGVLVVTVPVDRKFWEEYRQVDHYGTQSDHSESGTYFFQRYYDEDAVHSRLLESIPARIEEIRWFGERTEGWFAQYEQRWLSEGRAITANDPRFIVDNFQQYHSWSAMPGKGVCGLMLRKV